MPDSLTEERLNIRHIMAFRQVDEHVLTLAELSRRYPIRPVGTLTYYGIAEENVRYFHTTGRALQPKHRCVIDGLMAALYSGYATDVTFQLVVEALQKPHNYAFVADHLNLVERLANELKSYQDEAEASGYRLNIIVRFGSEMNDKGGTAWAEDSKEFVSTFQAVRDVARKHVPSAIFPFSPALRADLDIASIERYWPGDRYVDLVGATWYVHGESEQSRGFANMTQYFLEYAQSARRLSLDEFGGADGESSRYFDNDCMLKRMFKQIVSLADEAVRFEYGTVFLDECKYGVDARLTFINHDSCNSQ